MKTGKSLKAVYCCLKKDDIWGDLVDTLNKIIGRASPGNIDLTFDDSKIEGEPFFIVAPLFEIRNRRVLPTGLSQISEIRKKHKWWSVPALFLVNRAEEIPDLFLSESHMSSKALELIKHPGFGDKRKAILSSEVLYNGNENTGDRNRDCLNIVYLQDFKFNNKIAEFLHYVSCFWENEKGYKLYKKLRKDFHISFIRYYDRVLGKEEGVEEPPSGGTDLTKPLEIASTLHNRMSGKIEIGTGGHMRPMELFRAPIPFLLT